jgi:hypothetical protein
VPESLAYRKTFRRDEKTWGTPGRRKTFDRIIDTGPPAGGIGYAQLTQSRRFT